MSDFVAELDRLASPTPTCIERLVKKHGEDKRELIETAFNHHAPAERVASLLTEEYGIHVSNKAILKHRNPDKNCGCR